MVVHGVNGCLGMSLHGYYVNCLVNHFIFNRLESQACTE